MAAKKITVKVLDAHRLEYPDGHVETRSSHPMEAPPDVAHTWHPALGRFVLIDKMAEYPFEAEVDDCGDAD